ncbi:hypothetical protein [Paenirhodobacter sp.]|uniref:hypothetical protein n=1 Tax=Paenirhodobacter sp. TaxID=1965326 RepID=UPI003B5088DA
MEFIGFKELNAGLNNQKFAILGLFATAKSLGKGVSIPGLVDFSPEQKRSVKSIPFGDVFSCEHISEYAAQVGVEIQWDRIDTYVDPAEMFKAGNLVEGRERFVFLAHLRPSLEIGNILASILPVIYPDKHTSVVQLRIEKDWHAYAPRRLAEIKNEDNSVDYKRIIGKAAQISQSDRVFFTCDEQSIEPGRDVVDAYAQSIGLKTMWKSDVCTADLGYARNTELDFQVALHADVFIGTCRSTFANVLASAKAATAIAPWRHYLFNGVGDAPALRTDNGLLVNVGGATRTTPV